VPKKLGIDLEAKTTAEQYSLLAAATVASKMGVQSDIIKASLATIQPFAGRMQKLQGIHGSIIVDDSYNSSPEAVKLALNSLYEMKAPQKIAVLGNMNELGDYSKGAHEEIGKLCDPKQLELVVTIGPDANEYLAPTAQANGCQVQKFDSPYKAGEYIRPLVKKNAAILVKGSQNRVFAEETIKSLLANPADSQKLVRQSPAWLKKKNKAFGQ
jgi:UDP-N-acetylmuramoyl-tripeptide--D-alanyl-D-alanine ligase